MCKLFGFEQRLIFLYISSVIVPPVLVGSGWPAPSLIHSLVFPSVWSHFVLGHQVDSLCLTYGHVDRFPYQAGGSASSIVKFMSSLFKRPLSCKPSPVLFFLLGMLTLPCCPPLSWKEFCSCVPQWKTQSTLLCFRSFSWYCLLRIAECWVEEEVILHWLPRKGFYSR